MLAEYRQKTKGQFDALEFELQIQRGKFDAVVAGVNPLLNCIDMEVVPDDRPPRPNAIIDRCKAAWTNFKSFNRDAAISVVTHVLSVV